MTWKQIEMAEAPLRGRMFKDMTKEEIKLFYELACRRMINSCLIYWTDYLNSRYKDSDIKELWIRRVKQLHKEQLEDFKKAEVKHCVYEDAEGCTYNSIKWADEL